MRPKTKRGILRLAIWVSCVLLAILDSIWGFFLSGGFPACAMLFQPLENVPFSATVWLLVNFPARVFSWLWIFVFQLPPQNEVGTWAVVPFIAVCFQWIIIGGIVDWWLKKYLNKIAPYERKNRFVILSWLLVFITIALFIVSGLAIKQGAALKRLEGEKDALLTEYDVLAQGQIKENGVSETSNRAKRVTSRHPANE